MGSKLFLDDCRPPYDTTWAVVRDYQEFVSWIEANGCPDVISFDHDLALEHYDSFHQNPNSAVDELRAEFSEKTGYDAAKWLVDKGLCPKVVLVHSFNPPGAEKIAALFHGFCRLVIIRPYQRGKLELVH
jgi:hypothetical protein